MPTINLDQDHKVRTIAVTKTSVLTCISTSGQTVFTRGSTDTGQNDLRPGDSMVVKEGLTLVVRIFCTNPNATSFSASLTLESGTSARAAHLAAVRTMLALPPAPGETGLLTTKKKKRAQ